MGHPTGVHLVGSMPLGSAEEVFRTSAAIVGNHVRRLPDGETGARGTWIAWQTEVFRNHPDFELEEPPPGQYAPLPRFALRDGADPGALRFDRLGYSDVALASYAVFQRLKQERVVPAHVRFLVALPTPLAPVSQFVGANDKAAVEPAYEEALLRELAEIAGSIPHEELAVQWDIAVEPGMWAELGGIFFGTWFEDPKDGIVERLARTSSAVPEGVELGHHLCYGDFGHEHYMQPEDTAHMVEMANGIGGSVTRSIEWLHLPVPRDRSDDAYFAPLGELRLHPETDLYLGLVHYTDGVAGTRRRIEAARRVVGEFGVGTECGFGRRPAETIEPLLRLHTEVAAPVRA